jgi:hypothetical protein
VTGTVEPSAPGIDKHGTKQHGICPSIIVLAEFHRLDKQIMREAEEISGFAEVRGASWWYFSAIMSVHTFGAQHLIESLVHFADFTGSTLTLRVSQILKARVGTLPKFCGVVRIPRQDAQCRTGLCLRTKPMYKSYSLRTRNFITTSVDCIVSMSVHVTFMCLFQYWRRKSWRRISNTQAPIKYLQ